MKTKDGGAQPEPRDEAAGRSVKLTESQKALRLLACGMLGGLLSVFIYAANTAWNADFLAILSVGILFAGASAFGGGTLGFLFGIPRTLQQNDADSGTDHNPAVLDSTPPMRGVDYRVNTNLEQISDWLTKILVGVGLTQIAAIRYGLRAITVFAATGLGSNAYSKPFAFVLLCYSTVLGFLFGYLWTRLFLAGALRLADQAAIGALAAKVETQGRKLDELERQSQQDAEALDLADRQLNSSPAFLPDKEALFKAIAAASQSAKIQVFTQAWLARSANWRHDKEKMARTIPLFEALIKYETDNERRHMNHGQLGFALKGMVQPKWTEAEKELTTAINLSNRSGDPHGWPFYEFNRAMCKIMLDARMAQNEPSDPKLREEILEDLRRAARGGAPREAIQNEESIKDWMSLNGVTQHDIQGP